MPNQRLLEHVDYLQNKMETDVIIFHFQHLIYSLSFMALSRDSLLLFSLGVMNVSCKTDNRFEISGHGDIRCIA